MFFNEAEIFSPFQYRCPLVSMGDSGSPRVNWKWLVSGSLIVSIGFSAHAHTPCHAHYLIIVVYPGTKTGWFLFLLIVTKPSCFYRSLKRECNMQATGMVRGTEC